MKILKSIRFKFLFCLLGISILPILILFGVILKNNMEYYNSQISAASDSEVQKMVTSINSTFVNLNDLMTSLIFSQYDNDSCMLSICEQEGAGSEPTPMERLTNYRRFEYVSSNLIGNNTYASGVYLFTESGYTYSFVKNKEFYLEEDYQNASWYRSLQSSSEFQIIETYQSKHSKNQSILLARRFTDVKGKHTGVLAVVCTNQMFDALGESTLPWGESFLMDADGEIIPASGEPDRNAYESSRKLPRTETTLPAGESLADRDRQEEGLMREEIVMSEEGLTPEAGLMPEEIRQITENNKGIVFRKDTNDAYIYGTLDINDWKIVSEVSFDSQKQLYTQNMKYLILLIMVIILFVVILGYLLERMFIRPLVELSRSMNETPITDLTFHHNYQERKDEIGSLYRHFDKMMKKINCLIEDIYVAEIKFLKSRLRNLISQINAHFIFNTLENINCLAKIEKNNQIAVMSKSLGDMLRYSMEYETDEETLATEISHIRDYLNIQEIRFGSPIQLKTECPEEILESRVLKFLLQPVIENAIEHGLAGEEPPWIITVRAYQQEEKIIITVEDNGTGVEEETLREVRRRIYHSEHLPEDARYASIGLSNIYKRIQLLHGEEYGLEIENLAGSGVEVKVCLPFQACFGEEVDQ
ncbi:sensor histidine kinase [uncultured Robinsoniella sp.]|uniref:cache domain-containing sensor histidine kinase n=1 Tax=uncultured Robinsoniella sp. TaxID=904190 RepID=UPI00374E60F9